VSQAETMPASPPMLHFGWRVVAASFLVTFTIYGVSIFAFIVLIQSLAVQRGWTPADTGGLVSAMWLAAPLALLAGPLAQRANPWRMIAVGIALQAVAIASMLVVTDIWQIYLLRFAMGVGKVMAIAALPMLVSPWFKTRFATAMAIVWAGGSAGGLVLSPVMDALIVDYGWQRAALIVAAGAIVCLVVIQLLAWGPRAPDGVSPETAGDSPPRAQSSRESMFRSRRSCSCPSLLRESPRFPSSAWHPTCWSAPAFLPIRRRPCSASLHSARFSVRCRSAGCLTGSMP